MARIKGLVPCSVNFEVNKTAPLDSRTVIDSLSELTLTETWAVDGKVWLYDGLVVAVKENNSLYMLSGQEADATAYSDLANWHQIDATAAKIELIDNLESTDNTKALAASQGKALSDKIESLKASLSSVYNYKGSVATYAELPENPVVGDVYNVEEAHNNVPAGTNYAWNGTAWDALGGSVDLSGYYLKSEVDSAIDSTKTELVASINDVKTKADANEAALLIVNGDASTSGSLANTLKLAKEYTDDQGTKYVEKEEGKSLISSEKLTLIDTNASNIAALDTRVEANEAALGIIKGTEEGSIKKTVDDSINNALAWQEL